MAWVAGQEIPCVSRLKSLEWIMMLALMSVSTDHQERSLQIQDLLEVHSQDQTLLLEVAHLVVVTMREEEAKMIEVASLREDLPSSPEATHQEKMVLVQVQLEQEKVAQKRPETAALAASVAITPQEETVAVEKEEAASVATVVTAKEEAASAATVVTEKEEVASAVETVAAEAAASLVVTVAASVAIAEAEAAASAVVIDNQEELKIIKNLAVLEADPASVASESLMLPVNESTVSSLAFC